ncbi:MAG: CRTAC1 family protein [Phycisphaerae bacterium]|jgi:hypothetical protein|nr:CRTAC1 family protein [Phycisphaerae bacterium]
MNRRHVLIVRWGAPSVILAALTGALAWSLSLRPDPSERRADGTVAGLTDVLASRTKAAPSAYTFEVLREGSGLSFHHFPSARASVISEDMGSGVAWGDYDSDGDPDLFLVNEGGDAVGTPDGRPSRACGLFRNEGDFSFTNVSEAAGVALDVHGMAAAWGDFDADGDLDLYVTCVGPNVLFENQGDGTFRDVTAATGVGDPSFSSGCTWVDFDRDGRLDLSVCNYLNLTDMPKVAGRSSMHGPEQIPASLNPSSFPPMPNRLYRNIDGHRFEDVAARAGVANPEGRSLEDAWFDFDRDGWPDLYVANDVSANGVYRNRGDGTFEDIGARSLAADYRGAMGLAVGDPDCDGDFDLLVTHWLAQENAYFENLWTQRGNGYGTRREVVFVDSAEANGLGYISLPMVGWGAGFADFDNDAALDLWVVNGSTLEIGDGSRQLQPQRMHLFAQTRRTGHYREVGLSACDSLAVPFVGRGGAAADIDGDGRIELVVQRHGDAPLLLRNTTFSARRWIRIEIRQPFGNTFAIGGVVEVAAAGIRQMRQIGASASYLSQDEMTAHFGLGDSSTIDEVVVHWPDGATESHRHLSTNQTYRIVRGAPPVVMSGSHRSSATARGEGQSGCASSLSYARSLAAHGESTSESEGEQEGRVPHVEGGGATKQYPQRYERVAPTKESALLLVRSPNDFRHGLLDAAMSFTVPRRNGADAQP